MDTLKTPAPISRAKISAQNKDNKRNISFEKEV